MWPSALSLSISIQERRNCTRFFASWKQERCHTILNSLIKLFDCIFFFFWMESVTATTTTGDVISLSTDTTAQFGFAVGSIVHFTKSRLNGRVALIRGVHDGMLWFSLFHTVEEAAATDVAWTAPVQTTSCRGREEYIRQYGWMVDEASPR